MVCSGKTNQNVSCRRQTSMEYCYQHVNQKKEECPICYEECEPKTTGVCSHKFCDTCLQKLKHKSKRQQLLNYTLKNIKNFSLRILRFVEKNI